MEIYFLRHANAGQHIATGKRDEKRPLDAEGIEQSHEVGKALKSLEVKPAIIVSSPLKRAVQTAELVGKELGHDDAVQLDDSLRPDASYQQFQALVRQHSKQPSIMVVGHNPTLSEFLSRMISDGAVKTAIELRKGAVAKVEIKRSRGTLSWCITPRVVRGIHEAATSSSRPNNSLK